MIYSHDVIKTHVKKYIDTVDIKDVYFGQEEPLPDEQYHQRLPWSRLILPISGEKTIRFATEGMANDFVLTPGQVLFVPPWGWSIPRWTTSHDMLSVIFERYYLRVLFIHHEKGMMRGFRDPDYYFHIEDSISISTVQISQALSMMPSANCKNPIIAVKMTECLLHMVYSDIVASHQKTHSQAYLTWQQLKNYLRENYNHKISRESISDFFCITPQYVSKLFKRYSSRGFNNYLNWVRLNNAISLLERTKLNIEEISFQCGFTHNSHFIKLFRLEYGVSPGRYRAGLLKSKDEY